QDDKGWDARKRAYCLKIQPATGSFARNLIYSTKPQYPRMVADIMNEMFTIDGKPNQPVRKMIMGHAKKIGLINLLKDGIKGATAL
ncbi:hypothetical protein ACVURZ_12130, partial [Escherichia coli]